MANQQRSVIMTAIVLAVILGGVLVWLLNRTPADQLTTQAPAETTETPTAEAGVALVQSTATPTATPVVETTGSVQGVAATAPTGAGMVGVASALSGLGGLGVISLAFFRRFRR